VESRRWNQVESPGGITWNCRDSTDFTVAMRLVQPIPPKTVAMRLVKAAKWIMRLICPKWRHMWTDPAMPPPPPPQGGAIAWSCVCGYGTCAFEVTAFGCGML